MFYITMYRLQVIYDYMALDVSLRTSDNERVNLLPLHELLSLINSNIPQTG